MRIVDEDPLKVTIELETPEGQQAYMTGLKSQDRRAWTGTQETCDLNKFIQDNRKFSQIVVKCDNGYTRVK